ncbi:MAG: divergent polysaccharide deacetylase family protein [Holosporaceae bacterium]
MRKKNDSKEKPEKKRAQNADKEAHEDAEGDPLEEPKRKSAKSSKVAGFFNQFIKRIKRFAIMLVLALIGAFLGALALRWMDQRAQVDKAFSKEHLLRVPTIDAEEAPEAHTQTTATEQTALVANHAANTVREACAKEDGIFYRNLVPFNKPLKRGSLSLIFLGLPRALENNKPSSKEAQSMMPLMPTYTTVALASDAPHAKKTSKALHQKGCEILVLMPLESQHEVVEGALLSSDTQEGMQKKLDAAFKALPLAMGLTHVTGSRFTQEDGPLSLLCNQLCAKGALFLETMQTPNSRAADVATDQGVLNGVCDAVLDLDSFEGGATVDQNTSSFGYQNALVLLKKRLLRKKNIIVAIRAAGASAHHLKHIRQFIKKMGVPLVPLSRAFLR